MRLFVAKRRPSDHALEAVECFEESERIDASVSAELAEIEGLEAQVFLGADLLDVARTTPAWFGEARRAALHASEQGGGDRG